MLGFGTLGKRFAEGVVGLFAVLGFMYVPLGRRTGFEHARAVLSTPAAAAAVEDFTRTALELRQRAVDFVMGHAEDPAPPVEHEPNAPRSAPRPVPPKLK